MFLFYIPLYGIVCVFLNQKPACTICIFYSSRPSDCYRLLLLVIFRYTRVFLLELGFLTGEGERSRTYIYFIPSERGTEAQSSGLIYGGARTLTVSHPPMRDRRLQLRLPPFIVSKIYYGVNIDSKFWFSQKLENEWHKTPKSILLYFLMHISFHVRLLIGQLLILYLSKLFRHKFIIRSSNSFFFSSAPFLCCTRGDEVGEGIK